MAAVDRLSVGIGLLPSQHLLWIMISTAARQKSAFPESWFDDDGLLIADVNNQEIRGLLWDIIPESFAECLEPGVGSDIKWEYAKDPNNQAAWNLICYNDDKGETLYTVQHGNSMVQALEQSRDEKWRSEVVEDLLTDRLPKEAIERFRWTTFSW